MNNKSLRNNQLLRFFLRCAVMMAVLLPTTLWGQVTITTDANGNGTIDDNEKVLYLIQTNQFQSFYMIPNGNNVSTANIPNAQMLWYFLDAGEVSGTQYYYIINNSTEKCIYNYNGNSRGIQLAVLNDLSDSNKEKCKFKLVEDNSNGTVGFYNIDVKASQTYYGLNKWSGSVSILNPVRLTNTTYIHDYSSKWKFIPYNGSFTWPAPPFTPSTNSQNYYYKIHNITNGSYYVSSDASTPKNVTIASTASDNMVWYFKEASTDSWIKYYYIVNPVDGEYMYYLGTATNGSDHDNAIVQKEKTSENEDRFQFIIVQTARVVKINNVDTPVECYTIIPKLLKDQYWNSNSISPTSITEGNPLGIRNGRGSDTNNAHWEFESTTFVLTIPDPAFSVNCDNTVTITYDENITGIQVRYTIDDANISSSYGTPYDGQAITLNVGQTLRAIAYKDNSSSNVVTRVHALVYSKNPVITFTSATEAQISYPDAVTATIYYTMTTDGTAPAAPTNSLTGHSAPCTVTFNASDNVRIRAIAEADNLNPSCDSIENWRLPQPVITIDCDNVTLTIASPYNVFYSMTTDGSVPGEPTTPYTDALTVAIGNRLKVIARDNNGHTSAVLDYTHQIAYSWMPTIVFTSATTAEISYPGTATIYYNLTEDGSDPGTPSQSSYTGGTGNVTASTPLNINNIDPTKEIRISAIAVEATLNPSCAPGIGWRLAQPTITTSCDDATLTITSPYNVFYSMTTNGSEPGDPTLPYTSPLTVAVGYRLKVIAQDNNNHTSAVLDYTHHVTHTASPTIAFNSTNDYIIITGPTGSTIYYTTDGTDPIGTSTSNPSPVSYPYNGGTLEIRAKALAAPAANLDTSCVVSFKTLEAPTMSFSTDDCSVTSPRGNILTISHADPSVSLWYAATPGQNSEAPAIDSIPNPFTQYTSPVTLDALSGEAPYYSIHIYAKSASGTYTSLIVSENHEMKTGGKPTLTEPTGSNPVVGISGGILGDSAVCTIGSFVQKLDLASDGTAEFTIPSGATGTLSVAFQHGYWLESCPATYNIPEPPATPVYSQECDNPPTLSTSSPMAVIHYTIDGTEALSSSYTYYPGCLDTISFNTRIRAKAFDGFLSSAEIDTVYKQTHVEKPSFFVNGTEVTISVPDGTNVYYTKNEGSTPGVVPSDPADPDPTNPSQLYDGNFIVIPSGNRITVFKAIAVPTEPTNPLDASCVKRVVTRDGYSITTSSHLSNMSNHPSSYFFLLDDVDATGFNTSISKFTGILDGDYHTISNLSVPLFDTISDSGSYNSAVLNVMLKDVNINTSGNAGAIAKIANGYTRIYNCGILPSDAEDAVTSSIAGNDTVGGLVGVLNGTARVINCFSYADITGGNVCGGIVGYNKFRSTSSNLKTMVMNCMFYGDITSGSEIAPIYGGEIITNAYTKASNTGLNNYNYFRFNQSYINNITHFNCALGAQDRYLNRFEFFRNILNSNRELAMWYVSANGSVENAAEEMGHWVLDKSLAPYPILKAPGTTYPSLINYDAEHAVPIGPDDTHRNEGRKLGELTVYIQKGSGGEVFNNADADIDVSSKTINIIDKDFANYNFNYKKIQLPYYNEVGHGNYTNNRVVTGWKIVKINGSSTGTGTFTTGNDAPAYNFVDRTCTNKDLYSGEGTGHRVFNQGAYWEVPDGVTSITIEPYWAKAVYLSDSCFDVTYKVNQLNEYPVTVAGKRRTTVNGQTIVNSFAVALDSLNANASHTVYDYAIVLAGNYHKCFGANSPTGSPSAGSNSYTANLQPVTVMSADFDYDNEPDYTFFYQHTDRLIVAPIRFDFINMPGVGMAQKATGSKYNPEPGIFHPRDWFEITNTVLIRFGQFEYADNNAKRTYSRPTILQGGIYEQFISARKSDAKNIEYLIIGGNCWFKNFANGCHTANNLNTPKKPISVAGGDYEHFYLSGIYRPQWTGNTDNAECYIDGGRFGEVAGAGMQVIGGDVTWKINGADMERFYGGGINDAKPVQGKIETTISNSYVGEFCGGPKFGTMNENKTVTTTATNCHFDNFFGAGCGGTAINRVGVEDLTYKFENFEDWNDWVDSYYQQDYQFVQEINIPTGVTPINTDSVRAISTSYEYEYMFYSGGAATGNNNKVARFYINFATLSLASTRNVSSNLTGCTIGNFYGGGKYGSVDGDAESTLTDCIVTGDVFGSGFSATAPTCEVMDAEHFVVQPSYDNDAGVFNDEQVEYPHKETYIWKHADEVTPGHAFDETGGHFILTTVNLNNLGTVSGDATLTIQGNTQVHGEVYGGGALSSSNTTGGTIKVNILGGTYGVSRRGTVTGGNIFGGGKGDTITLNTGTDLSHTNVAVTEGRIEVNIGSDTVASNNVVINGSVYGCNNINGTPQDSVFVDVYVTKHTSNNSASSNATGYAINAVFGGGKKASFTAAEKTATVHIHSCENTVGWVFGGGDAAHVPGAAVIIDGGRFDWVFGGGNGAGEDNPGANVGIEGDSLVVHGGLINHLFGGSNEKGEILGPMAIHIDNESDCEEYIDEFFGGSNLVETGSSESPVDLNTVIECGTHFGSVYGGSNLANIWGNVTLTINGGEIENVFGGSKGRLASEGEEKSANISGDVELNLHGGTITNAFGGSNKKGNINGIITVNVEDAEDQDCPLVLTNVYGGGNLAAYTPDLVNELTPVSPLVNIQHGTVEGNVFGGGLGETAIVYANPTVTVGDIASNHENYVATVNGSVFGGGDLADVDGITTVLVQKCNSYAKYVYGGGNADTVGGTRVFITGGVIDTVFGGGKGNNVTGALARVKGNDTISITSGTIGKVFAGSNLNGEILGRMSLNIDKSDATDACDMIIGEVYGGGNLAAGKAGNISVGCTGTLTADHSAHPENIGVSLEGIGDLYGGGNLADINSDSIKININSGIVNRVFGGNNTDGDINGAIVVNIEKIGNACDWYVGDVFGGGNLADYNGNPVVYIKNGTVSGNVYGGGNGDPTDPTQNPGATHAPTVIVGDTTTAHSSYQAIVIGDVYGGGNAAKVTGSGADTVLVLKNNTQISYVYGGGNAANVQATFVKIADCDTIECVFGGGHGITDGIAANVIGGDSICITGGKFGQVFAGSNLNGVINGPMKLNIDKLNAGTLKISEVYGGSNQAEGNAGSISLGCTGTLTDAHISHPEHIGTILEGIGTLYGGSNQADINNKITLNVTSGIINNVFGGNNTSGEINNDIEVNINKADDACVWYVGDVYGGGNHADYDGTPKVKIIKGTVSRNVYGGGNDITDYTKGVDGSDVEMTGGIVLGGIYGGCNLNGSVTGNSKVKILSGEVGSSTALAGGTLSNVFGGGLGQNTKVDGHVTVTIDSINGSDAPVIWGDVYGGSALGTVNSNDQDTTTVNIINGHIMRSATYGGNIYGGGLGDTLGSPAGNGNVLAEVKGVVNVNIGKIKVSSSGKGDQDDKEYEGEATIGGNVYGCNNTNGSPESNVIVNIYHTAHTAADTVGNDNPNAPYAIANVFGGGNLANYTATGDTTMVNIFGCDNTIYRVFGGSNAAAAQCVKTDIKGGRIQEVFGGGNGEVKAADIHGDVILGIHGGNVKEFYGGSNQNGTIDGDTRVTVDNTGCDNVNIDEFFCGGKFADYHGNINATITCSEGMTVKNLYGGCKQANVVPKGSEEGHVHLTVWGGTFENVYGGSQGTVDEPADIAGNVTLDIYGGTITNAIFGGSNINGSIGGKIIVTVIDSITTDQCPLDVANASVYGGGNQADYTTPVGNHDYPQVNIKKATVKNVFGGGLEAKVKGNPQVQIKKGSKINGNVYGGGNMGEVDGNPRVIINGKQIK